MKFSNTLTIDRPVGTVFAYLADLENLPRWNYAIAETRKISAGPVGVGSRYRQIRTIPDRAEESLELIEFDPDRSLAIRGSLNAMPADVSYTLHADGDTTTLTNAIDLQPPMHLILLGPIATNKIKAAVAANLDVLKQTLERA